MDALIARCGKGLMMARRYEPGTPMIYQKTKRSPLPGPRAEDIQPTAHGEEYLYTVDKFWVVAEVQEDGQLILQTRRGKRHVVSPDDPLLRPMTWWERLLYRHKIPTIDPGDSPSP